MRSSTLVSLFTAATIVSGRACKQQTCKDECAQLVVATSHELPTTRLADCSSFLAESPFTVFSTVTVTPVLTKVVTGTTIVVYQDETVTVFPVVSQTTAVTTNVQFQDTTVMVTPVVTQSTTITTDIVYDDTTETLTPITAVWSTVTTTPVYEDFTETVTPVSTVFSTITPDPIYSDTTVTASTVSISRQGGGVSAREIAATSSSPSSSSFSSIAAFTGADVKMVPDYAASACPNSMKYSSACSCAGVKASANTTTVITTVTAQPVTTQIPDIASSTISRTTTITGLDVTVQVSATDTSIEARTTTIAAAEVTKEVPVTEVSTETRTMTVTAEDITSQIPVTATSTVSRTMTITAAEVTSQVYTSVAATTITRTTTTTAVSAVQTGYQCGSTVQGNGIYSFRRYRVNCGQRVTSGQVAYSSTLSDEPSCLRVCNSIKFCVYAEYAFSSGQCNLYYTPPSAIVDDTDMDALILL